MSDSLLCDKTAFRCSLCNVEVPWNGVGKVIKTHVKQGLHCASLRKETIKDKRARSIAVKGILFESKYYKPVTEFFGKYAAVESTFKITSDYNESVVVVRFFSPEVAQRFLDVKSTWVIKGQFAHVLPDVYTKGRHVNPRVTQSIDNEMEERFLHHLQQTEKNKEQYNSYNTEYNAYENNLNHQVDEEQKIQYPLLQYNPMTISANNYHKNDLRSGLANEYRSVSFTDKNQGNENELLNCAFIGESSGYSAVKSTPLNMPQKDAAYDFYSREENQDLVHLSNYRQTYTNTDYSNNHTKEMSNKVNYGLIDNSPIAHSSQPHANLQFDVKPQNREKEDQRIHREKDDQRAHREKGDYRAHREKEDHEAHNEKGDYRAHREKEDHEAHNENEDHRAHEDYRAQREIKDHRGHRAHRAKEDQREREDHRAYKEKEDLKTHNQNIQRRERSRSPILHDNRLNSPVRTETAPRGENKRRLPKVRGSLLKGSFSHQLQGLLTQINADVCQASIVKDICYDVRHALGHKFKGTEVKPFGSMNLGIGIKGASLEICAFLPNDVKEKLLQTKSLRSKYLKIIRDALNSNSSLFQFATLSEDSSTVNFVHNASKYDVKLGLLRDAMVLNDELLEVYITSDRRIQPIFVFLIFWAYSHDILEESVFEEHEMILLIIFYLQRLSKPILPPAHMLQVDYDEIDVNNKCLSYWRCTFRVNAKTFPRNENKSDRLSLIEGFFLFYSDFVFKNVVISPFSGLTIPAEIFHDNMQLPTEYKKYKYLVNNNYIYPLNTESAICVQDPIKLNRNATLTINPKKLANFHEKCLAASGLMYRFRTKQTEDGLACALLNLPTNTVDRTHKLTSEICTRHADKLNNEEIFLIFRRLSGLLDEVFNKILKVKFTTNESMQYANNKDANMEIVYSCTQYYNVWSSRKMYKNKIPYNSSILEWEAALTDKIIDSVFKGQSSSTLCEYSVKASVSRNEKTIQVDFMFQDVEEDTIMGLTSFICPIIEYELKRISIV